MSATSLAESIKQQRQKIESDIMGESFVEELTKTVMSLSGHDIARIGITAYTTKSEGQLMSDNVQIIEHVLAKHFECTVETIRDIPAVCYMHGLDKARAVLFLCLAQKI